MAFDMNKQREFQVQILRDQLKNCWMQFHETAQKWLEGTKHASENRKVSAETKKIHPNQIMADLKKINYQRAYIEFKIETILKNRKLPGPADLMKRMKRTELSVEFQQEFPSEFADFTKQLRWDIRLNLLNKKLLYNKASESYIPRKK